MIITFISDTHSKHKQITNDLIGGDLLIHAGDISSMGYKHEISDFCEWFDSLNYESKVFIAGNHDWGFLDRELFAVHRSALMPKPTEDILSRFDNIKYLRDSSIELQYDDTIPYTVYGSPWQPEFFDWAFNLPRNGTELEARWNAIPEHTDILVTHGPAYGKVDRIIGQTEHLGCELLAKRISKIKPKIHVCGHIHSAYGYAFVHGTHYINASVLNERYMYTNKPLTVDWDPITNDLKFL